MSDISLSDPAMEPPGDTVPNFENPPSNNTVAWGAFMMMLAVSTLSVGIRTYASVFILRQPKIEDLLVLLGFGAFIVALWTDLMYIWYPGYFVHTWNVTVETEIQSLYYVFLFGTFYSIALAMVKIAIPLDWIRLFVAPGGWRGSYFWWGAMGIVVLQSSFLVVIVILLNVQCIPHQAIWDLTLVADAQCIPLSTLQKLSASIHLITDVIILLLPQRIIWHLHLSLKKKLGLAVVFSLGALGVVCSVFRLYDTILLSHTLDTMYFTGPVLLWCTAEMTCGFFVACAPVLPRVVQETPFLRRIIGSTRSASSGHAGGASGIGGGLSSTGGGGRSAAGGRGAHLSSSAAGASRKTYSQIDEEDGIGMQIGPFGSRTESTEELRGDGGGVAASAAGGKDGAGGILRTTHITVAQAEEAENEGDRRRRRGDPFGA